MPKRTDLARILLIGSGPIVIGQGAEFDYSGTQAVKALKEEGYTVILVNSNPATIMTDPEYADRTYIEPLTPEVLEAVLERERPDAVLPTVGGQTALNLAVELARRGVLDRLGIRLIGASREAVEVGEDRRLFKVAMQRIGLDVPRSGFARTVDEARAVLDLTGLPAVIRPSFTLGGTGGGIAYNAEEFEDVVFALKDNQVSDIFRTVFGFHIAKVYGRKPEGFADFAEVQAGIQTALHRQKQERAVENYLDRLRAKAVIQDLPRKA